MRSPGSSLLRLAARLGLIRLKETVLLPTIADMLHECHEARTPAGKGWSLVRGYWSVITGSLVYAAVQPARYLREDWSSTSAAGPRFLHAAGPPAFVAGLLMLVLTFAEHTDAHGLGFGINTLLMPGWMVGSIPVALAMGAAWTLTRARAPTRVTVVAGALGALFSFTLFELIVTDTNQAYRQAAFEAATSRHTTLSRGSREMSFVELSSAASLASSGACPTRPSSCASAASAEFLRTEWHNRLSAPAFAIPFVLLAAMVSRLKRRSIAIPCLFLVCGATFALLRLTEGAGMRGDVPIALAAWTPHLLPLLLAVVARVSIRERRLTPTAA